MTEDTANENQDPTQQPDAEPRHTSSRGSGLAMKSWQAALVALLAGLLVWGTVEAIMPVFRMPQELAELSGAARAPRQAEIDETTALNNAQNVTLSLAISAAAFAVLLTITELVFRGSPLRAAWGAPLAGVIAGGIGIGAGMAGAHLAEAVALRDAMDKSFPPLIKALMVHCTMWGIVGLGVGLGIGLPIFRPRLLLDCLIGCLVGGLLGAIVFLLLAATVLPNVATEVLLPDPGIGRFLWIGLAGTLMGITVAGLGKEKPNK